MYMKYTLFLLVIVYTIGPGTYAASFCPGEALKRMETFLCKERKDVGVNADIAQLERDLDVELEQELIVLSDLIAQRGRVKHSDIATEEDGDEEGPQKWGSWGQALGEWGSWGPDPDEKAEESGVSDKERTFVSDKFPLLTCLGSKDLGGDFDLSDTEEIRKRAKAWLPIRLSQRRKKLNEDTKRRISFVSNILKKLPNDEKIFNRKNCNKYIFKMCVQKPPYSLGCAYDGLLEILMMNPDQLPSLLFGVSQHDEGSLQSDTRVTDAQIQASADAAVQRMRQWGHEAGDAEKQGFVRFYRLMDDLGLNDPDMDSFWNSVKTFNYNQMPGILDKNYAIRKEYMMMSFFEIAEMLFSEKAKGSRAYRWSSLSGALSAMGGFSEFMRVLTRNARGDKNKSNRRNKKAYAKACYILFGIGPAPQAYYCGDSCYGKAFFQELGSRLDETTFPDIQEIKIVPFWANAHKSTSAERAMLMAYQKELTAKAPLDAHQSAVFSKIQARLRVLEGKPPAGAVTLRPVPAINTHGHLFHTRSRLNIRKIVSVFNDQLSRGKNITFSQGLECALTPDAFPYMPIVRCHKKGVLVIYLDFGQGALEKGLSVKKPKYHYVTSRDLPPEGTLHQGHGYGEQACQCEVLDRGHGSDDTHIRAQCKLFGGISSGSFVADYARNFGPEGPHKQGQLFPSTAEFAKNSLQVLMKLSDKDWVKRTFPNVRNVRCCYKNHCCKTVSRYLFQGDTVQKKTPQRVPRTP